MGPRKFWHFSLQRELIFPVSDACHVTANQVYLARTRVKRSHPTSVRLQIPTHHGPVWDDKTMVLHFSVSGCERRFRSVFLAGDSPLLSIVLKNYVVSPCIFCTLLSSLLKSLPKLHFTAYNVASG